MQNMFNSVSSEQPRYRSGAVARMVRIPVSTLRIWERRYRVVGPSLTDSGHRLYTGADVERLLLIKQLIDIGHAVGTVARLPTPALQDISDARAALQAPAALAPVRPRAALLGLGLPRRLGARSLQRVGTWANLAAAEAALDAPDAPASASAPPAAASATATAAASTTASAALQADLLVAEMATLQPESAERLLGLMQRLGVQCCVLVYGFGAEGATQRLRDAGCRLHRAPLSDVELRMLVDAAVGTLVGPAAAQAPGSGWTGDGLAAAGQPASTVPARLFDDDALAQLAAASTTVACECPRHVVELVMLLGNFETYSAECVSRSPADAALHGHLQRVSGQARAMFEAALVRVAEADAIPLPAAGPGPGAARRSAAALG